ncbi:hypothetical protein EJP82_20715 [Paenibacillus anaericanus]|uniref:Uncharacterized protein n=1 Tax=Paenibacillus anaericanus TaxID=170367 RepID=A0A3S1BMX7_9BACL|nr:hypothetical protein [Paenibacillus anaericanus]RUT43241.1 hypothetical protein EJP82_20715 [Paenibacillus anaericanus]
MSEEKELERELSEMLADGDNRSVEERREEERRLLSPKYEIRIQTQLDPIVEETLKYRSMAKEIDDRYDNYLKKTKHEDKGSE